jgi:hypothetical protein
MANPAKTRERASRAERNRRVFEMRKQGVSCTAIARAFGISQQRVSKICADILREIPLPAAWDYRRLQVERLEGQLAAINTRRGELAAQRAAEATRIEQARQATPPRALSIRNLAILFACEVRESIAAVRTLAELNRLTGLTDRELEPPIEPLSQTEALSRLTIDQQAQLADLIRIMNGEEVPVEVEAIEWQRPSDDMPPQEWKGEPEPEKKEWAGDEVFPEPIIVHDPMCVAHQRGNEPCYRRHTSGDGSGTCVMCGHFLTCEVRLP